LAIGSVLLHQAQLAGRGVELLGSGLLAECRLDLVERALMPFAARPGATALRLGR
jgi:hypothetical protein